MLSKFPNSNFVTSRIFYTNSSSTRYIIKSRRWHRLSSFIRSDFKTSCFLIFICSFNPFTAISLLRILFDVCQRNELREVQWAQMLQVTSWYNQAWSWEVAVCHLPSWRGCGHSRCLLLWSEMQPFYSTSCSFWRKSRCQWFHHSSQLHPCICCSRQSIWAFCQHCLGGHAFLCRWHWPLVY